MPERPHCLFVAYGAGHVAALLPVAKYFQTSRRIEPIFLALTTAAAVVRRTGIRQYGFLDFVEPSDVDAVAFGAELATQLGVSDDMREESAAYLGLCYRDLVTARGAEAAARAYAEIGRQAFEPVAMLERIVRRLSPDVVVSTSAPRAEKAALLAAGRAGIPSLCVVDLFGIDESAWLARDGYATRVAVFAEAVRAGLVARGRSPDQVVVTGNPAFDELRDPSHKVRGQVLRIEAGWESRDVVVWASQQEPLTHPNAPEKRGDPTLPSRIGLALIDWVSRDPRRLVVYRLHPSETVPTLPLHPQVIVDQRRFPLVSLLCAADAVVTMNSTVGLQAYLLGKPVVQMLGSIADDAVPLAKFGMAAPCETPQDLENCLACRIVTSGEGLRKESATASVAAEIERLLAMASGHY